MSNKAYRKRYFKSFSDFSREIGRNLAAFKSIKKIKEQDKISGGLAELIMLSVIGVNDCINCSYRHTTEALKKGVGLEQAVNTLKGQFHGFPEDESRALVYARHWADKAGVPDPAVRQKVTAFYGKAKTAYMEFFMQVVYTGNMVSNTVEAYRRKVRPGKGVFGFFLL